MSAPKAFCALIIALVCLMPGRPLSGTSAVAEDQITVTVVPETPAATVVITPELPPTEPPVVSRERSTPVITPVPAATEGPIPTATSAMEPALTPTVASGTLPGPVVAVTAPPMAPLPSAADLETNARLRWGDRVPPDVRRWAFIVVPAAHRYGVSPNLIAAVMTMESGGDPLAWNASSDARGLMQVLHGPWDPRANVNLGTKMLSGFVAEFGDLKLALAAYNAGPNAVIAYGGVPPYRETRDYVIVVSYLFDLYRNHSLTQERKKQYHNTLSDLSRFGDQRKRVKTLAKIGHIPLQSIDTCGRACQGPPPLFQTGDPFWPVDDVPDPLQPSSDTAP